MVCGNWSSKLDAYLDGELSGAEMTALDAHLRSCSQCAPEALARMQLKRAIKSAGQRFAPTADFKARVLQSIASQSASLQPRPQGDHLGVRVSQPERPTRRLSLWNLAWAFPAAALALLLVTILITGLSDHREQPQTLASELTDQHVATLASSTPVDVVSTDRHTVKPWFQGKIPFTFNLPELQGTGFELMGGRVTYLDQVPGAHLIYQLRKHEISVFIFPEKALPANLPSKLPPQNAFHLVTFTQAGLRYYVLGDTNPSDLESLASLLRASAAS